jgi:hypothetical protein
VIGEIDPRKRHVFAPKRAITDQLIRRRRVINTVPVITAHIAATSHPFESDPVAGSNAAATVVVVAATVVVVAATVVVVSAGGVYVDIIVNAS